MYGLCHPLPSSSHLACPRRAVDPFNPSVCTKPIDSLLIHSSTQVQIQLLQLLINLQLLLALVNFFAQSFRICFKRPLRLMNPLKALNIETVFQLCAASMCMARNVDQVNKQLYCLTLLSALFHLWTKNVHSNMREQRFVRSNSLLRQICDQLWSQLPFSFQTVTTVNTRALQNVHLQVQNLL